MQAEWFERLAAFIVKAKAATYVGDGESAASTRLGSHDLRFSDGDFSYLDSYFGGTDFIGEEVVYFRDEPVWAMNYYGRIIFLDLISGAEAGQIIKESLSAMYAEGRFLGGFSYQSGEGLYEDSNQGDFLSFTGIESISKAGKRVYELVYHGGLIKP